MIRAAIRSFIYDDRAPAVVDLACQPLPLDAELAARNAARIAEARKSLGSHWIGSLRFLRRADSTNAVGAHRAAPAREPHQPPERMPAPELVTGTAADMHPDLPAMLDRDRFELQR